MTTTTGSAVTRSESPTSAAPDQVGSGPRLDRLVVPQATTLSTFRRLGKWPIGGLDF